MLKSESEITDSMSEFLLCLAELFTTAEDRSQILGRHSSSMSEVSENMNSNSVPEGETEVQLTTEPSSSVVNSSPVAISEVPKINTADIPLPPSDAMDTTNPSPRPSPPPTPTPEFVNPGYAPVDCRVRREDEVVEQQMFQWNPHPTAPVMVPPDYQGTHNQPYPMYPDSPVEP